MADTSEITPGERRELRAVVRQQFAVLRAEVKQREEELKTDIARQVVEHYAQSDTQLAEAMREFQHITNDAARQMGEVLDRYPAVAPYGRYEGIYVPSLKLRDDHRLVLTAHAEQELKARVSAARLRLDRQEADLLRELSIGALGTEQAHRFLAAIPSVSDLVPAARIAELESQFGPED